MRRLVVLAGLAALALLPAGASACHDSVPYLQATAEPCDPSPCLPAEGAPASARVRVEWLWHPVSDCPTVVPLQDITILAEARAPPRPWLQVRVVPDAFEVPRGARLAWEVDPSGGTAPVVERHAFDAVLLVEQVREPTAAELAEEAGRNEPLHAVARFHYDAGAPYAASAVAHADVGVPPAPTEAGHPSDLRFEGRAAFGLVLFGLIVAVITAVKAWRPRASGP